MKLKCGCGAIYQIKPEFAGKQLKCRKCEKIFRVPESVNQTTPTNPRRQTSPEFPPQQTPQPKPSSGYWVKPGQGPAPHQKKSKQKAKPKNPQKGKSKVDRDQALLDKYSSGSSLEERMASRRRDSIEGDRVSNGLVFILKGVGWFVVSAFVFWIFHMIDQEGYTYRSGSGGFRRRSSLRGIIILLYYLKGKYWLPPLIATYALYHVYIGIGSLSGKVDIVNEDDLPMV